MSTFILTKHPLFQQPFASFLATIIRRYPTESNLMLGEADVSPESAAASRHPKAWAPQLFPADAITDHREFERGVLGLRHFYDVVTGNHANMPALSADRFGNLQQWVNRIVTTEDRLNAAIWSIIFNDLGKLKQCQTWYTAARTVPNPDHDAVLAYLLKAQPSRFPGFADLHPSLQSALVEGLETGFNLGQAVQLECPAASWDGFIALSPLAKDLFLLHTVFDFFGVTGAVDPEQAKPFILNNENVDAYFGVATHGDYDAYLEYRGSLVGLTPTNGTSIAQIRMAGMARLFNPEQGEILRKAWTSLHPLAQAGLAMELVMSGKGGFKAILPYYAPALIVNILKRNPQTGLAEAMHTLDNILAAVRNHMMAENVNTNRRKGVFIANLHAVASAAAQRNCTHATFKLTLADNGVLVEIEESQALSA